jgi:F0F1-type ATP synthase assembly protein I
VDKAYDEVDPQDYDPSTDPLQDMSADTGLVFVLCTVINSMLWMLAWFYLFDTAKQEWDQLKESVSGQDSEENLDAARRMEEEDITVYTSVQGRDNDMKTIEETVSDREKLTIMKRFFVGVSVYIVASILVFFLPVFLPSIVNAVMLGLYDLLLLGFVASLLWIFRLRQSNQFVPLSSSESMQGAFSYTYDTELGVVG